MPGESIVRVPFLSSQNGFRIPRGTPVELRGHDPQKWINWVTRPVVRGRSVRCPAGEGYSNERSLNSYRQSVCSGESSLIVEAGPRNGRSASSR